MKVWTHSRSEYLYLPISIDNTGQDGSPATRWDFKCEAYPGRIGYAAYASLGEDPEARGEMMPIDKDVLTTGEVAKICNVAPRTVSKWFDSGSLKGYRIPGSKDRRIPVPELIKFMKVHGIPLDGITGGRTRVLIVDDDAEITNTLKDVLLERTNYDVHTATSGFEAGMECERFRPHVLLLDMHLGDNNDADQVSNLVLTSENLQMTKIVPMSGKLTDGQAAALASKGFEGFLRKPFQVRQVVESIEAATAMVY